LLWSIKYTHYICLVLLSCNQAKISNRLDQIQSLSPIYLQYSICEYVHFTKKTNIAILLSIIDTATQARFTKIQYKPILYFLRTLNQIPYRINSLRLGWIRNFATKITCVFRKSLILFRTIWQATSRNFVK
jgi:hypothetical protein